MPNNTKAKYLLIQCHRTNVCSPQQVLVSDWRQLNNLVTGEMFPVFCLWIEEKKLALLSHIRPRYMSASFLSDLHVMKHAHGRTLQCSCCLSSWKAHLASGLVGLMKEEGPAYICFIWKIIVLERRW